MALDLNEAITLLRKEAQRLHEKADKLEEISNFLESVKEEEELEDRIGDLLEHGRF